VKATRREAMLAALALPAGAGMPRLAQARAGGAVLLHDPTLAAGRRFAAACCGEARAIEGDRIRFAREVFARRPGLVLGVSRAADALLIEEVGREMGYRPVAAPAVLGRHGWALAPRP
jgi:hypothetical protein